MKRLTAQEQVQRMQEKASREWWNKEAQTLAEKIRKQKAEAEKKGLERGNS